MKKRESGEVKQCACLVVASGAQSVRLKAWKGDFRENLEKKTDSDERNALQKGFVEGDR